MADKPQMAKTPETPRGSPQDIDPKAEGTVQIGALTTPAVCRILPLQASVTGVFEAMVHDLHVLLRLEDAPGGR